MYVGIKSLAEAYAREYSLTKLEAYERVKDMFDVLANEMLKPKVEGLQIVNFVTLRKIHRASRQGRNPRTGEMYYVPAKIGIKAILGKEFNDVLNN